MDTGEFRRVDAHTAAMSVVAVPAIVSRVRSL